MWLSAAGIMTEGRKGNFTFVQRVIVILLKSTLKVRIPGESIS